MHSAADVLTLIVASALATMAIGLFVFTFVSGVRRNIDLLLAGLFAGLYSTRMFANTMQADLYLRSFLEYLTPIPGAALFAHYLGTRWRWLNRLVVIAFVTWAVIAIPYELIRRAPFAAKPVVDALVLVFMLAFAINLLAPGRGAKSMTLLRTGLAVFGLFVVNEHLHLVALPWLLHREPIGFLFFMGCLVLALMQQAVVAQGKLLAVENELTMARTIQQSIIPANAPFVSGLEVAALYKPATHVGGDFYEFLPLPQDRLGIFIADVSGHGVPAALVASMLKIAIAAQDDLGTPSNVLAYLNRLFAGRLKRQFITALYAVVDLPGRTLSFSSAGHPPLLLLRSGEARELMTPGFVVGRDAGAQFTTSEVGLDRGDVILFYTDGLVEAANRDGEAWGYARLQEHVEKNAGAGAAAIAESAIHSVEEWSRPAPQDDDFTIVVVKC
ncbi:MAG TPA: PP2C family protein-serine/threonine phosphatase [Thermoanaerobaculia bacterium]|nr:PP2C family protein-serine/threonine phosphatase [Thermoanaerobaculia bacterium]